MEKVNVSCFKSTTNILTMRSDLAKLFYENRFSIDVDVIQHVPHRRLAANTRNVCRTTTESSSSKTRMS